MAAILVACHHNHSDRKEFKESSIHLSHKVESATDNLPLPESAILGLHDSVYKLFFYQGIFAGQDGYGNINLKYQQWQVPLVMGAMLDFNQIYLNQFHAFLPVIAKYQPQYGNYADFMRLLYKINNWDSFPKKEQLSICRLNGYCPIIDDRLWWVNFFISYADGLMKNESENENIDILISYSYKIFKSISRPTYLNKQGTRGSYSLMWHSGVSRKPYYKATIANSLYVTAGARLAQIIDKRYTNNKNKHGYEFVLNNTLTVANGFFLDYSNRTNTHFKESGLLLDGVGTGTGQTNDYKNGQVVPYMFTYNQGVVLPGMAILTKITGNQKYQKYAVELIESTIAYTNRAGGIWDDLGYQRQGGWLADYDGIAFRLAYWQYLGLFVRELSPVNDSLLFKKLSLFIRQNSRKLELRTILPESYGININESTLVGANHPLLKQLPTGNPFSAYPDGYSVPGVASLLELLLLQHKLADYR